MTLDEKLEELERLYQTAPFSPVIPKLIAALKKCPEQRDYYQDQLCDLYVGSYGTPIKDDAELLALLEVEK